MTSSTLVWLATLVACRGSLETSRDRPSPEGAASHLGAVMRAEYQAQGARATPPLALVPSDGSELALTSLVAEVTLDGPLAHTKLHLTFKNTEARPREGRFSLELPEGAAVSRFAMLIGAEWREARVVSRERGREVYESFLHRRVDPALLEQDLGNRFSARVFPIAPLADKELVIGYDHLVADAPPYTLALRGLPAIPRLSIAIQRDGERTLTEQRDVVPDDVVVAIEPGESAVAGEGAFVARVELPDTAAPMSLDRTLFLVDTSASRQPIMRQQGELIQALVGSLGDAEIAVAVYDQQVTELYRGPAARAGQLSTRLYEHGALGASDLGGAIARAVAAGMRRIVIVGDGVITQGEGAIEPLVGAIRAAGIERVDAVQLGNAMAREVLGPLVAAGRSPGAILDGRRPGALARALGRALPIAQPIEAPGATAVWPRTTLGAVPGRPLFVTGRGTLRSIKIGERVVRLDPRTIDGARVARMAARAEVGELGERLAITREPGERAVLEQQLERLALAHGLVSARTSLLVLESDADEELMLGPRGASDPTSTRTGITLTTEYFSNIPGPGRTFESVLGTATGVSYSGSSSHSNKYVIDRIDNDHVITHTQSSLGLDHVARAFQSSAFAFGQPQTWKFGNVGDRVGELGAPYRDRLAKVMSHLAGHRRQAALDEAARWQVTQPGDLAALIGLGEALEAAGAKDAAARAYGSIVDLYPNRFELLRVAGERFDRLGQRELAVDAYRRSLRERPDQLSTYRLLAFALLRAGHADEAFARLLEARRRALGSVAEVIGLDAAVVAAHLVRREPGRRRAIEQQLGSPIPTVPTLHIVLGWETDANDVDLHVVDRAGDHASFASMALPSGGALVEDVTDGYGPEMFAVERPRAFPYHLAVHYYNRGPMGLGLGTVQVIRHDGQGNLTIDDRPFVLQRDGVMIPLGSITGR